MTDHVEPDPVEPTPKPVEPDERIPRTMAPSLARVVGAIIDATPRKTRRSHPTEATHERRSFLGRLWHGSER